MVPPAPAARSVAATPPALAAHSVAVPPAPAVHSVAATPPALAAHLVAVPPAPAARSVVAATLAEAVRSAEAVMVVEAMVEAADKNDMM